MRGRKCPVGTKPGFDDARWQPAQSVSAPGGQLAAQMMEPIRVTGTLKPIAINEAKAGRFYFRPGAKHGRLVPAAGARSGRNGRHAAPRGAAEAGWHTLRGQSAQRRRSRIFTPLRARAGSLMNRVLPITDFGMWRSLVFPASRRWHSLEGRVVNDDLATTPADFACSTHCINRIYRNRLGHARQLPQHSHGLSAARRAPGLARRPLRGIQGRDLSVRHRGALRQMACRTWPTRRKHNGSMPDVSPAYWPFYSDNVTWPSSAVIIPGTLLDQFGDTGVMARHYASAWEVD